MLYLLLILNLIINFSNVEPKKRAKEKTHGNSDLGGNLASQLKNDQNLDLSVDEEYEDLRAEFLAYHTALSSLVPSDSSNSRRSLISTPCWKLGGICINYKLCTGFRSLTEVPGCKDKHKVCCFVWNKFNVRDLTDEGIGTLAMPWSLQKDFGGKGIIEVEKPKALKSKKKKKLQKTKPDDNNDKTIALIIRTNKNFED